jgi:hypothetical protein
VTPHVGLRQRRARLAVRHHLAAPATDPETVAASMLAMHATDPATVHLGFAARLAEPDTARVERALYDERTLVRMLGMRRTMFVVPADLAPVVQAACTDDVANKQHKLLVQHLTDNGHPEGVPDADAWLADVAESTARALAARGSATPQELAEDEPRLRQQLIMARGKPYEAIGYVTNRVLSLLAMRGRIVRGRPRGSWLSTQYLWWDARAWLSGELTGMSADAARAELARGWLRAFGPAPVADLRWWTGWTAAQTKKALAEVGPAEVDLDGTTGLMLSDDLDPVPEPEPWVALLPALDPTAMGWAERGFYLGEHRARLFDLSGNIGPTVWADGRIVGGWAQRPDGEVTFALLEDVGAEKTAAVAGHAARLTTWLGDIRVVPKFRTPLERELST